MKKDYIKVAFKLLNILSILSILISAGCRADKDPELGIVEFLKQPYQQKLIGRGSIAKVNKTKISRHFTYVDSAELALKKIIFSTSKEINQSANPTCLFIPSAKMIAPFEQTVMDRTWNVKEGEEVIVYLGFQEGKCYISHLSKVVQEKVQFPEFKGQSETEIREAEFLEMMERQIKKKDSRLYETSG